MTRTELINRLEAIAGVTDNQHVRNTINDTIYLLQDDITRIRRLNEELLNVRADRDMLTARIANES